MIFTDDCEDGIIYLFLGLRDHPVFVYYLV